jgi:uncharacterized OsmC-like protein
MVISSCAGYYAAAYLRKKGLATEGTRVRVTAAKVAGPARLENFNIEVSLPLSVGADGAPVKQAAWCRSAT